MAAHVGAETVAGMIEFFGDAMWFLLGVLIGGKFLSQVLADFSYRQFGESFGDAINEKTKDHPNGVEIKRVCLEALRETARRP